MNSLNPTQQAVVDSNAENILCIAGPGSGKTHTLVERIKRLCRTNDARRFVVITFTNDAADELKKRIGEGIQLGYVGTLHGFALRMLQANALTMGFPERITVLDEDQTEELLKEVCKEQKYTGTRKDLDRELQLGPRQVRATAKAELVAAAFFKRLRSSGLVTFDTLLHYGVKIAGMVTGYTHLFVDEFQDSGDADQQFYEALEIPNKFFVGDPDQAIYGFRGGNVQHIVEMAERKEFMVFYLTQNYRSDIYVCRAADALIGHNAFRVDKQTRAVSEAMGKVEHLQFSSHDQTRQYVIQQLLQRPDKNDCAVLLRNNYQVDEFKQALAAVGLPVASRAVEDLPIDWTLAKALVAYFADPQNDYCAEQAMRHASAKPIAAGVRLEAQSKRRSVDSYFLQLGKPQDFDTVCRMLAEYITVDTAKIIREIGLKLDDRDNLSSLVLALSKDFAGVEGQYSPGVTVTTMHKAKGREWGTVYLPHFEDHVIPGARKDLNVEEERRLAFVAVTRAKHELYVLTSRGSTLHFNSQIEAKPSRFCGELGLASRN